MNLAEAFNQTFAGTSAKQPKKSDRIQPETPLNLRGAFEAATNIPVVGDALSGGMAVYDAVKGDYPSAAMNALGVLPFVSGTFIGKSAKTWDAVKAAEAEKRLAAGDDVRNVWKETGTFKGPDGHLRQEIDDTRAGMRLLGPKWGDESQINKLGETLDHVVAYKAYPDTKKINVTYSDSAIGGSYTNPRSWAEYIDLPQQAGQTGQRSTALHELQHAIQQREGFAVGGNPEMMAAEKAKAKNDWDYWSNIAAIRQEAEANGGNIDKAAKDIGELFDFTPEIEHRMAALNAPSLSSLQEKADQARKAMIPYSEHEAYRRLAGEAEARATQARMNMNMEQRLNTYPLDSYDVPVDQLIIRGNTPLSKAFGAK